jgi:hypothetical protein
MIQQWLFFGVGFVIGCIVTSTLLISFFFMSYGFWCIVSDGTSYPMQCLKEMNMANPFHEWLTRLKSKPETT